MNRLTYLLLPFVALAFAGCGPDENEENNDEQADRFERPEEAQAIVTDGQLDQLVEIGATIYPGSTPPELAGVYDRDSGSVVRADNEASLALNPCYSIWTVETTEEDYIYATTAEYYDNCSGTIESPATYLAGSDNCFSLYVENNGERDGCEFRWAQVISGCLENGGISDYQEADLGLENDGSAACQSLVEGGFIPDEGQRALVERDFVAGQ